MINSSHFFIFPLILFNVARLYHIEGRLLKFPVVILDMIMQGTVSQNCYLGPSFFNLCDYILYSLYMQ